MKTVKMIAVAAMLLMATGCATAQETLDLSEKVTEDALWYLVVTEATVGAFIDHIESHPEIDVIEVTFPDGTNQKLVLNREEALTKLREILARIAPLRESMVRLNTSIQKGSTFVAFFKALIEGKSVKELVLDLLPGVRAKVESVLGDEPEADAGE